MRQAVAAAFAALTISACQQAEDQGGSSSAEPPVNMAATNAAPASPASGPSARTPLAKPSGAIDPKSAEAAGQVVQSYGALVEQARWTEANALWGDRISAAKVQSELSQYSNVQLEIGNPGETEGAAGSIYVTVPAVFYGDLKNGQPFRRSAEVLLRRVNDVPGSTAEQRRWHIERIDWAAAS
jgi:hypothetical protein